ncbi:MAG TPA: PEGA domain-containing protein [Byssovorax sp.]|jgi:hypothetical protein
MQVKLGTMAFVGCAAVCASLTAGSTARAADAGAATVPLAVVSVEGNDAEDQADALTKALRNAVRASKGWSLASGEFSLEVIVLSLKCTDPPDAACQAKVADQIKSDRYLWGYIKKKGPNVAGEVALWVRGKGTTRVPVEYSANLTEANDDALKRIATDVVNQLAGNGPKGGIHVSAGGIVGQLFVDGEPMGALANGDITLQLLAGDHVVSVKAPGYTAAERSVTVLPNATKDVSFTLLRDLSSPPINGRVIAGWSLLGGGVALAGAGAAMGILQISNKSSLSGSGQYATAFNDYRAHGNGCDVAAQGAGPSGLPFSNTTETDRNQAQAINGICGKDKTYSLLQFIFYPAAVVAAGAGVYFLVTAPKAQKAAWNVTPSFGKKTGQLDFTLDF